MVLEFEGAGGTGNGTACARMVPHSGEKPAEWNSCEPWLYCFAISATAATIWRAEIPNLSTNSSGLPE